MVRGGQGRGEGKGRAGGGVGDAEDCSEVEMGMGAESFSSTAYSGTCCMDSGKTVKHSIKFQILGHFPNNYNLFTTKS